MSESLSVRGILEGMYVRDGYLRPETVVTEAADPDHPLHHRFVWDDAEAAEAHRLSQAADLIRSVKISVARGDGRTYAVRAFPHVPMAAGEDEDSPLASYHPTDRVAADPVMRALVQARMEREWKSLRRRYQDTQTFWSLILADAPSEQRTG